MNDELKARAERLLALRDKATPGKWDAWTTGGRNGGSGRMQQVPDLKIRAKRDVPANNPFATDTAEVCAMTAHSYLFQSADAEFICSAHDMADLIRDLLAEVERLTAAFQRAHDQAFENGTRAHAAEARLRELASAEPVAWLTDREATYFDREDARRDSDGFIEALIRRPEMPSFDCMNCGGTGDVSGEYPGRACPACSGTGRQP